MDDILSKYYNLIAKLCSVSVIAYSFFLFIKDVLPQLNKHSIGSQVTPYINNVQIFIQIISVYFSLFVGLLLYGRSKIIWQITMLLLVLIACNNLFFLSNYGIFWVTIPLLCVLLIFRNIFNQDLFISYQFIFIFGFFIFALFYGIIGTYLFRESFVGVDSILDSLYFTIVTYSTVGYGDVYPKTILAKIFVISMILIGMVVFATSITFIAFNINKHLKNFLNLLNKGKVGMKNHVLIVGYGIFTKILIEYYLKQQKEFLIIDTVKDIDFDRQKLIDEKKLFIAPYIGHKDTLLRVQAELSSLIIISYDSDEATIFGTMNTREYILSHKLANPPKIVARILYAENISKAKMAGADVVIAPHVLAAEQIINF